MQYRIPVGAGPSLNTCPKCASHSRQLTAVRTTIKLPSTRSTTFSAAIGCQKLGHPVPESNFAAELNSAKSQHTHRKIPRSSTFNNAPVNGLSVSSCRVTQYDAAANCFFHSASLFLTRGTVTVPAFSPAAENSTTVTTAGPSSAASGRAAATVVRRNPQNATALTAPAAPKINARRPSRDPLSARALSRETSSSKNILTSRRAARCRKTALQESRHSARVLVRAAERAKGY